MRTKLVSFEGKRYAVTEHPDFSDSYLVLAEVNDKREALIVQGDWILSKTKCSVLEEEARILVAIGREGRVQKEAVRDTGRKR